MVAFQLQHLETGTDQELTTYIKQTWEHHCKVLRNKLLPNKTFLTTAPPHREYRSCFQWVEQTC